MLKPSRGHKAKVETLVYWMCLKNQNVLRYIDKYREIGIKVITLICSTVNELVTHQFISFPIDGVFSSFCFYF